jgi:hypothetical protein
MSEISGLERSLDSSGCDVTGFYSNDSVITWYGNTTPASAPVLGGGTWSGTSNINLHCTESLAFISPSPSFSTISNLIVTDAGGGNVNATFHLLLNGRSATYGAVNATVDVQQRWAPNGGESSGLHIQDDSWRFLNSYVQYPQATSQVKLRVAQWVRSIDNVCCNITDFYTNSSSIRWYGNTTIVPVFGRGTWVGSRGVNEHYSESLAFLSPSPSKVTISNMIVTDAGGGKLNATFRLFLTGSSDIAYGRVNATANVQLQWTYQGWSGGWHIRYETWDFLKTYVQTPAIPIFGR